METRILKRLSRLRRRLRAMRGIDRFLEVFFLLASCIAAAALTERILFETGLLRPVLSLPSRLLLLGIGGAGIALLFALAAAFRPVPSAGIARRLDASLQTEELFLAAAEAAEKPSGNPFEPLLLRRADEAGRDLSPASVVPRPPLRHRWAILLALAALVLLCAMPPRIHPAPTVRFSASPLRGPAPLDVRFEEACIGPVSVWEWDFGDGSKNRGRYLTHRFEKPGSYTVRLKATGPGGTTILERACIEVVATGTATADFLALPEKGRAPLTVRFRNLSRGADEWNWDFGDGTAAADREPEHRFEKPGAYDVTLRARGGGTEDRVSRTVKVAGPDEPLADFAAHPVRGPAPLTVRFEERSTGKIDSFAWDFGDPAGVPSDVPDPLHAYRMPGVYTVSLSVRGPGGEDVETKEFFIHVGDPGEKDGGGGSGTASVQDGSRGTPPSERDPAPRPDDVVTDPEIMPLEGDGETVEKIRRIVERRGGGSEGLPEEKDWYDRLRRAAEEVISRETVPEPARETVRKYFESIRPKEN